MPCEQYRGFLAGLKEDGHIPPVRLQALAFAEPGLEAAGHPVAFDDRHGRGGCGEVQRELRH
jgi:hypothetical protein